MLSPPYSPHGGLLDSQHAGNSGSTEGALSKNGTDLRIRAVNAAAKRNNKPVFSNGSRQSSRSSSSSCDDDDDTDDSNGSDSVNVEGRSQSVHITYTPPLSGDSSAVISRVASSKRSAVEAFGHDSVAVVEEEFYYEDGDDEEADSEDAAASPRSSVSEAAGGHRVRSTHERRMTTCWDALKTNPVKYLRQERNLLDLYSLRRHSWAGPSSSGFGGDDSSDGPTGSARSPSSGSTSSGSSVGRGRGRKPGRQPGTGRGRRRASVGLGNSNGEFSSRLASRQGSVNADGASSVESRVGSDNNDSSGQNTSGSAGHSSSFSGGSASSTLRVHDLSYHQLEDYSPCVSLLPPGKSLRAEWKGAPMDLSGDPDLPLLHPAEAHLASVLRLPCDVYLDSKRRLFAEKVHRLKQGLPFRRTDSQKACRIDVNKASRLFGAFEKIGWLEDGLFVKYLERT